MSTVTLTKNTNLKEPTMTLTKNTNLTEVAAEVLKTKKAKVFKVKEGEVIVIPKDEYYNWTEYTDSKPAMTEEEALEILMAEIQKGKDSPSRPFEEFAKEYGF
ncbi:MAG: hypothetical protein FWB72_02125 [Firmicutes bacterium]|nr:hypothetical protein [Bacillota bacterium]